MDAESLVRELNKYVLWDSYVLNIKHEFDASKSTDVVSINMELALSSLDPRSKKKKNEAYHYVRAEILFYEIMELIWREKTLEWTPNDPDAPSLGNIYEVKISSENIIDIIGEIGHLQIKCRDADIIWNETDFRSDHEFSNHTTEIQKQIDTLLAMSPDAQVQALIAPGVLADLVDSGQGEALMTMIDALPDEAKVQVLAVEESVRALADNGQSEAIISMLEVMADEAKAQVLSAKRAASGLAWNGYADRIIAIIKAMPEEARVRVLVSPGAVSALVLKKSKDVIAMIKALPEEAKAQVLASQGAVWALVKIGYAIGVIAMIKAMSNEYKAQVLGAREVVSELVQDEDGQNGHGEDVIAMIMEMSDEEKAQVLTGHGVYWALNNAPALGTRVKSIVEVMPERLRSKIFNADRLYYLTLNRPWL